MTKLPPRRLEPGLAVGPVETDYPLPRSGNNAGLRSALEELRKTPHPNASFATSASRSAVYKMAATLGMKVNCRRETDYLIRVWNVGRVVKTHRMA